MLDNTSAKPTPEPCAPPYRQAADILQNLDRLDAAFLNKYRSNPAKIAAWKAASRVERAPRRSETPAPAPVTP